jgi:hypothetical protein
VRCLRDFEKDLEIAWRDLMAKEAMKRSKANKGLIRMPL